MICLIKHAWQIGSHTTIAILFLWVVLLCSSDLNSLNAGIFLKCNFGLQMCIGLKLFFLTFLQR